MTIPVTITIIMPFYQPACDSYHLRPHECTMYDNQSSLPFNLHNHRKLQTISVCILCIFTHTLHTYKEISPFYTFFIIPCLSTVNNDYEMILGFTLTVYDTNTKDHTLVLSLWSTTSIPFLSCNSQSEAGNWQELGKKLASVKEKLNCKNKFKKKKMSTKFENSVYIRQFITHSIKLKIMQLSS